MVVHGRIQNEGLARQATGSGRSCETEFAGLVVGERVMGDVTGGVYELLFLNPCIRFPFLQDPESGSTALRGDSAFLFVSHSLGCNHYAMLLSASQNYLCWHVLLRKFYDLTSLSAGIKSRLSLVQGPHGLFH